MPSLYPLALRGAGTEDIEALPSYLIRLATTHGVSVHQLLLHLAVGSPPEHVNAHRTLQAADLPTLIRANATTEFLVQLLADSQVEHIETLRSATLLPLRQALNRSTRDFSQQLRWCPACFQEQVRDGDQAYFKLIWLLRDVKACRHHHMYLKDECQQCSKPLDSKSRWPSAAYCCHCEVPLFRMTKRDRVVLDSQAAALDLVLLIADMVVAPNATFPPHGVSRYLRRLLDVAANTRQEIDLYRSIPYEECWRYTSDSEPITLRTARRIAYRLEVPIYPLLLGGDAVNKSFGFAFERPLPFWLTRPNRAHAPNREWLRSSLLKWLKKPPRSLAQIATQLGVSGGALRYQCPDLVAEITSRWKQMMKEKRESKRKAAVSMVEMEISQWDLRHSIPISRKALLRVVREQSNLPKYLVRQVVAKLYLSRLRLRHQIYPYSRTVRTL